MELKIKKCPRCSSEDYYTETTGKATNTLQYSMIDNKNQGGDWNFDNCKQRENTRCSNCHLNLNRYILQ